MVIIPAKGTPWRRLGKCNDGCTPLRVCGALCRAGRIHPGGVAELAAAYLYKYHALEDVERNRSYREVSQWNWEDLAFFALLMR